MPSGSGKRARVCGDEICSFLGENIKAKLVAIRKVKPKLLVVTVVQFVLMTLRWVKLLRVKLTSKEKMECNEDFLW